MAYNKCRYIIHMTSSSFHNGWSDSLIYCDWYIVSVIYLCIWHILWQNIFFLKLDSVLSGVKNIITSGIIEDMKITQESI